MRNFYFFDPVLFFILFCIMFLLSVVFISIFSVSSQQYEWEVCTQFNQHHLNYMNAPKNASKVNMIIMVDKNTNLNGLIPHLCMMRQYNQYIHRWYICVFEHVGGCYNLHKRAVEDKVVGMMIKNKYTNTGKTYTYRFFIFKVLL